MKVLQLQKSSVTKGAIIFFLTTFMITPLSSCKCENNDFADLTGKVVTQIINLAVGDDFDFKHVIINAATAVEECLSNVADSSSSEADIDYFRRPSDPKSNKFYQTNGVPQLDPNKGVEENYVVNFGDTGVYMINLRCDRFNSVQERDEGNNKSNLDATAGKYTIYTPYASLLANASPEFIKRFKTSSLVFIVRKGTRIQVHNGILIKRKNIVEL